MTIAVSNTANNNTFHYLINRLNELADAMSTKVVTVESNTTTGNAEIAGTLFITNIVSNTISGGNTSATRPLNVSSNLQINDSNILTVGNSTVNVVVNSVAFTTGIFSANNTKISLGSNISITPNLITIGNSTVNSTVNSTSFNTGNSIITPEYIMVGNSTVNSTVNSTSFVTGNVSIIGNNITVGNSTVNVSINSTAIYINGIEVDLTPNNVTLPEISIQTVNTQTTGTSAQIVDSFVISTYRSAEYFLNIKNNSANGYQTNKILILFDGSDAIVTDYGTVFSNTDLGTFTANANSTHCRLVLTPTASNTQVKGSKTLLVL